MNSNLKAILIVSITVVILFFSCTAPFNINTRDSEPVLVIYGCLTDENRNQFIRLTRSSPYFLNEENQVVSDAKVWVTSSNGREYAFQYDKNGYYVSQRRFAVAAGVTYRLSVEVDFNNDGKKDLYEAETVTLPKLPVDSVSVSKLSIMGFLHYSLNIHMQDPIETENYYLFNFFINDTITNEKITDFIITDDQMFNGHYIDGISITYFNSASDFENRENDWDMFLVNPGDRIRLHIMNIEKGYYNFIRECMMEKYGENPFFGGPPSNIHTNLPKGAVGYFTSFCIQEKETVIP